VGLNFVLKGRKPKLEMDIVKWAKWYEKADRQVSRTKVNDGAYVSTVFLGLDHQFSALGPPILFETMIFGGKHDEYQERYSTWEEAEAGHKKAVKLATKSTEEGE